MSHTDDKIKAQILNNQFSSVFTREDTTNVPKFENSLYPELPNICVTIGGVAKLLSELNPHKAPGPDKLPARFLKDYANELAPPMALLFQSSLNHGILPDDWKIASVTPIFKKGDKTDPSNYRPISLTCITCKILEHIIHCAIINHLEINDTLSDTQHGFRKKRSCETQLILTCNDFAKNLNKHYQTDVILLDFSKAFDKVPHQRLLSKLHNYGIRHNTLNWIHSFLSGRTQRVVMEGIHSESCPVESGVPQGSVLGPLLFLVYINDLPNSLDQRTNVRLFADDCLLYRPIMGPDDSAQLQADLGMLTDWETKWQMSFNPTKCETIHITTKKQPIITTYTLQNHPLRRSMDARYLGINITPNLSWNTHIKNVVGKASQTLGFVQRTLRACSSQVKKTAYLSLVRPKLEYAVSVWDPHTKTNIKKLEGVQRRAARFCVGDFRRTSSVSAMLQSLNWPSLKNRRNRSKLHMLYKMKNNLVDTNLPPQTLQPATRRPLHFIEPHSTILAYQHSFFPSTIRLWNQLSDKCKQANTITTYDSQLPQPYHSYNDVQRP